MDSYFHDHLNSLSSTEYVLITIQACVPPKAVKWWVHGESMVFLVVHALEKVHVSDGI